MSKVKELKDMTPEEVEANARENAHVFLAKSLAETIIYAKKNYYKGYLTVSDETYDSMESALRILCPTHPVLTAVGDPSFEDNWISMVAVRAMVNQAYPPSKTTKPTVKLEDFL